jgi:hypothetical protein
VLPYLGPEILEWLISGCRLDCRLSNEAEFWVVFETEAKYEREKLSIKTKLKETSRVWTYHREGSGHVAR